MIWMALCACLATSLHCATVHKSGSGGYVCMTNKSVTVINQDLSLPYLQIMQLKCYCSNRFW